MPWMQEQNTQLWSNLQKLHNVTCNSSLIYVKLFLQESNGVFQDYILIQYKVFALSQSNW